MSRSILSSCHFVSRYGFSNRRYNRAPIYHTALCENTMRCCRCLVALLALAAANLLVSCRSAAATPPPLVIHVPILMYHHISDNSRWPDDDRKKRLTVLPEQFAEQLEYLQRTGYTT